MSLLLYKSINARTRRYKLMHSVCNGPVYNAHRTLYVVRRTMLVANLCIVLAHNRIHLFALSHSLSLTHSHTTAPSRVFTHSYTRRHTHNPCITSILDIYVLEHI